MCDIGGVNCVASAPETQFDGHTKTHVHDWAVAMQGLLYRLPQQSKSNQGPRLAEWKCESLGAQRPKLPIHLYLRYLEWPLDGVKGFQKLIEPGHSGDSGHLGISVPDWPV